MDVFDAGLGWEVDGLADRSGKERLGGGHHSDVALGADEALTLLATSVGAVEHGKVLGFEVRGTFDGHGAADELVGLFDLGFGEAEFNEHVERPVVDLVFGEAEDLGAELVAERVFVEDELEFEGAFEAGFELLEFSFGEALGGEGFVVDVRGAVEGFVADGVADDVVDLLAVVAHFGEGRRDRLVDDLEVSAAGKLLELNEGEVWLDTGGVAVHDEPDGAGGRKNRHLGVAVAVLLAELEGSIPRLVGGVKEVSGAEKLVDAERKDAEAFVLRSGGVVGGASVVANDAEHVLAVRLVGREWAVLLGHFGAGCVAFASEDGGEGSGDGEAFGAVVGDSHLHQQGAEVGVSEAEGSEVVAELGDFFGRELRHQDADFEHDGPELDGVHVAFDVELAGFSVIEGGEVDAGEVAGGVIEEHVLRARVGRVDAAVRRAGVPLVDRGVILEAGVGGVPGGLADVIPETFCLDGLDGFAAGSGGEAPVGVGFDGFEEVVGDSDRVVGVLAGDGDVGFGFVAGVEGWELDAGVSLLGELDGALDVVGRDFVELGFGDGGPEGFVGARIGVDGSVDVGGLHHVVDVPLVELGAGDEGGNLLLFLDFPVDELFDIGVVDVEADHLGCSAGGASGFDGTSGAIADSEEAHQAGGFSAAAESLVLASDLGEVGADA